MKQFFKMFFASLLAVVVASVIVVGITIGMIVNAVKSVGSSRTTTSHTLTESSILVLNTDSRLHEQGEDNSLAPFSNDDSYSAGLHDVVMALKAAKTDDKIKAVLLKL